jgi:hypothetical protein
VRDGPGGEVLLVVTRYGHFWRNLLAGLAGVACGLAFAGWFGTRALAAESDGAQAGLAMLAVLGGVMVIFMVDIHLSPRRDIRAHVPGGDRRAFFRLREDGKIHLYSASFTLWDAGRRPIWRVRKNYLRNLGGRRWTGAGTGGDIEGGAGTGGEAPLALEEDPPARSLLQRALGGAFGLFATDYVFRRAGREVGRLHRRPPWRTGFLLELAPPAEGGPRQATGVAMAVLADSVEWR